MTTFYRIHKKLLNKFLFVALLLIQSSAHAEEKLVVENTSTIFSNPVFILLLCLAIFLLIVIIVFADVLKTASWYKLEEDKKKKGGNYITVKTLLLFTVIGAFSQTTNAQDAIQATPTTGSYFGLDAFTFFMMIGIIGTELLIAYILYSASMQLFGIEDRKRKAAEEKAKSDFKQPSFIEKINASVAIEEEAEIMFDHDYDGIRELDNDLPPWWKYGFYVTIVFALVYMIHYHVSNTGKLQRAEYEDQLTQAKVEMEEYRKKAANLVDENNVTVLTDESALGSGKSIYMDNCAACHGRAGEGGVGPNLTDEYWLHSGSVKEIFKTIKYGWPEKGMKAWQQDLGAKQIHEVTSFILSLKGTNPPNAKEKQGELYQEVMRDTSNVASIDSTQLVIKNTE